MALLELGELQGEVLVFGGNYSNLPASQALQQLVRQRHIPLQNIICSGDVVAYCAQPEETVSLMRDWGVVTVMGNCEEALGWERNDCGCGFTAGTSCDVLSNSWFSFSSQRVSTASKTWMRHLPRTVTFELAGKRFQVVHGGVHTINRFLFASMPDAVFAEELAQTDADVVIGGHAGLPFARQVGRQYWLNAGVIGMPANDGQRHTWFMRLQASADGIRAHWETLEYDAITASRIMHERGLANGYADALLTGLWPSMDVLPETEQQQAGENLLLAAFTLR